MPPAQRIDHLKVIMATETELKLYCAPEDLARVELHPLIAVGTGQGAAQSLVSTYFDTPDLALQQAGVALRVRATPSEHLQTIKGVGKGQAAGGARQVWESRYSGAFDFSAVDAGKLRALLDAQKSALQPVFTTSFERRSWRIHVSRKIAILVTLDSGEISAGERVLPISEVTLELLQGKPEDLLDFAIALTTLLPLVPYRLSKAERAYQLCQNQPMLPHKAAPSLLSNKQSSAEAFQTLAAQCMQMWQANLLGTLTQHDPEYLHQFRIALRRLSSLLKVFKPALPERFLRQWTKRLKDLSQVTGDVRDLEVMQHSILQAPLNSADPTVLSALAGVAAAWHNDQQAAQRQIQQLSFGGPILLFARDIQELEDDFPKNLPRFAEKQLSALHRNTLKRLAWTLRSATPENAHRLRIALKHLRYSCEFFAPLFAAEEMLHYAKTVASLQDELGFINDFHVSLCRLQSWEEQGEVSPAARQAIITQHAAQAQATLAHALHLAEAVLSRCQPWCSECEQRGFTAIRRRLQNDITLKVE